MRRRRPWAALERRLRRGVLTARERVAAWRRPARTHLELDDVRRRLEVLIAALYGRTVHVEAAPETRPTLLERLRRRLEPAHLRSAAVAGTDGSTVLLPARMADTPDAVASYRLLALEQAERIARGTASALHTLDTPLERDLFLIREATVIDERLGREVRGLRDALAAARRAALDTRPALDALTPAERAVERLARAALALSIDAGQPATGDTTDTTDTTTADSLAWARERARELRGPYRGIAPVAHWGHVTPSASAPAAPDDERGNPFAQRGGIVEVESRHASPDGTGSRSDRPDPDAEGSTPDASGKLSAEGAPDQPGAAGDASSHPGHGADARPDSHASESLPAHDPSAAVYPEWHHTERRYRPRAVLVHERPAPMGDAAWPAAVAHRYAVVVRRIRDQFSMLQARRTRLWRQRDGEDLDLPACVQAVIDARTGHAPDDRLYMAVRPARRGMAICLLVDVSGSTDMPLASGDRVIDVAQIAVLLASEAFDALGDAYALLTFASRGAHDVRIATLKDFAESNTRDVRQRIAGMTPHGNTRLGAAVRHASARLAQQPAGRRLLLIVSDGRPNDVDYYDEAFGIEDARQAVHEARAQGAFPFCITIDRESGPDYLDRIFGPTGYTVLRDPEQLPLALVAAVRQLLTR